MSIALYRKYRPRRFSDVIGQAAVTEALTNQVASGRVGHSYIFTGIRGTGKTTFARILAKAVNCPNTKGGEPCCECEICRGIDDGSILDVTEIDAASNSGVDNIRELRDETAYAPAMCRKRVYIIDEVHMLSNDAFNALLKIMEEPPSHVMFIFATTELHKVPATILSRCQRFELRRISADNIEKWLMRVADNEGIDLTEGAAAMLARLADGAMRDALSLLETCSSLGGTVDEETVARLAGVADKGYLFEMCNLLARGDAAGVLKLMDALYENSLDPSRLCTELIRHVRDLMMAKLAGKSLLRDCDAETAERTLEQSSQFTAAALMTMLEELSNAADRLPTAPDSSLVVQLCLMKLCGLVGIEKPAPTSPYTQQTAKAAEPQRNMPPAPAAQPQKKAHKSINPSGTQASAAASNSGAPKANAAAGVPQEQMSAEPEKFLAKTDPAPQAETYNPELDGQVGLLVEAETSSDKPSDTSAESASSIQREQADDTRFEPSCKTKPEPAAEQQAGLAEQQGDGDSIKPFPGWSRVAEFVAERNGMVGGYLKTTKAYISGDCVLIESNEFFRNLMNMKGSDNKSLIREAIEKVTGVRYKLGAYTSQNVAAASGTGESESQLDELERLAGMLGN